eukprot:11157335-Lingulodinium_polyedra.AAC.2
MRGSFALAIRRNLSHVSSAALGSTLLFDKSRQSVVRSELDLSAAIVSSARSFHEEIIQSIRRPLQ